MSDINDLMNKIDSKGISRNDAINIYNNIAEKGKKLQDQDKHQIGKNII